MSLVVEIKGFDQLIADVERAGGNAKPLMKAAIVNSVNRIQSTARSNAPHRTGTLQRSIQAQVNYPEGKVQVGEKYGLFIEEGTGIYNGGNRITPKRARALKFTMGGNVVFAKSTKGMKARPFFRPGIEMSAEYVAQQFTKVIDIMTHGLAGRGF